MTYKGKAAACSRSFYENGKLVIEGQAYAEGESELELAAATNLGGRLAEGQAKAHGVARGLEKIAKLDLSTDKKYLLE